MSPLSLFDYPPIIEEICREWVEDIEFEAFRPHRNDLPESVEYDAFVVTGSKSHVYERRRWVGKVEMILRHALMSEVPVLGVCFGHQVLASALGGRVEAMQREERGFREIWLTRAGRESVLFEGIDDRFMSFTAHEDCVTEHPEDLRILAENGFGVQAFESKMFPAYGVQFHPEFDMKMARRLLESGDEVAVGNIEEDKATLTGENLERSLRSRLVYRNFFTRVV